MVKNLIKNGTDLLFRRQTNILSAATVIAVAVLASRILGLLKYRLLTANFTVSEIGVFIASFRLPNTIFDLIVMGALTTAFIPVFTSFISREKYHDADTIASTILNLSGVFFFFLSVLFLIFTEGLIGLMAPGLSPSELALAVPFTRIMLLGQTLPLVLGNFLTGILQSHKRFLVPALAPVVYNLGIILGIVFLSPSMGLYGAVWGVVLGAVLFLLIQIPLSIHLKFHYRFLINLKHSGVVQIGKLIIPRTLGLAITQLNYVVNLAICSLLATRAITIFNFAQQLAQLPIGIFAATISQATLPTLSEEQDQNDDFASFKKTLLTSLHQILFLTLPAAAILIILRIPIVRLVYGAAKFDWFATVETGRTLAFFGVGLVFESMVNLLVRGFYALHDSKTPVVIGSISILLNIIFSIVLIFFVPSLGRPVWALALAGALADGLLAGTLLYRLNIRVGYFDLKKLLVPAAKMFSAALLTGVSLYIPMKLLDQLVFDTTRTVPLLMLTGVATGIGLTVYFFLTWVFGISELSAFLGLGKKAWLFVVSSEHRVEQAVSEVVTKAAPESLSESSHEGK